MGYGVDPNPTPLWKLHLRSVKTPLRELSIDGYSIESMIPALQCPSALEDLNYFFRYTFDERRTQYRKEIRNSETLRHKYFSQDTLERAFKCLLHSVKILRFNHSFFQNYP
jgi:hypothetical protein